MHNIDYCSLSLYVCLPAGDETEDAIVTDGKNTMSDIAHR